MALLNFYPKSAPNSNTKFLNVSFLSDVKRLKVNVGYFLGWWRTELGCAELRAPIWIALNWSVLRARQNREPRRKTVSGPHGLL